MEFEDQPELHEQEEEEEDEDGYEDEDEANEERFVATYDLVGNNNNDIHSPSSSRPKLSTATGTQEQTPAVGGTPTRRSKYRECLKNQAVGIGSHAVDGCGEFLPSGPDGTVDALKCAACTCHRNFHRRENGEYSTTASPPLFFHHHHHAALLPAPPPPHLPPPSTTRPQQFAPHYRSSAASATAGRSNKRRPPPLTLPSTAATASDQEVEGGSNPSSGGGGGGGRKRFRTRFTAEQKERMFELAERLGWRIRKEDEAVVEQFCQEWGLRRQVLKVWMHNNKHTLGLIPNNNNNNNNNNNPSPHLQN